MGHNKLLAQMTYMIDGLDSSCFDYFLNESFALKMAITTLQLTSGISCFVVTKKFTSETFSVKKN